MNKREIQNWINQLKREKDSEKKVELLKSLLVEVKPLQKIKLYNYKDELIFMKNDFISSWGNTVITSNKVKLRLSQKEAELLSDILTKISEFKDLLDDL